MLKIIISAFRRRCSNFDSKLGVIWIDNWEFRSLVLILIPNFVLKKKLKYYWKYIYIYILWFWEYEYMRWVIWFFPFLALRLKLKWRKKTINPRALRVSREDGTKADRPTPNTHVNAWVNAPCFVFTSF